MVKMQLAAALLGIILLSSGCATTTVVNHENSSEVCFTGGCFAVEVADTPEERQQGLMFRESLAPGSGMLFDFGKEGEYAFWMKNTLIPLDMIWMNGTGQVVFIARDVQPCKSDPCPSIFPASRARYVLEVSAGTAERLGLRIGDSAAIDLV